MWQKRFLTFSSILLVLIGIILLVSPAGWFPVFYSPIFMGIIALLSPLLIYLPRFILKRSSPEKRQLILNMRTVIAFALIINFAGELGLFQLHNYGFEYDKLAHFTVCMLFAFTLGESLKEWERFRTMKLIGLVLVIVFGAGILWEILEAVSDFLFKTEEWGVYGEHLVWDTLKDISFNTLGAIAGIFVFMLPKGPKETSRD